MPDNHLPRWLEWAREIQALSQTGYHYAANEYQRKRYHRLTEIAAEIVSENSTLSLDDLIHMYSLQRGYATPKVDVRGAVFRNGELLLVREISDGGWTMPGGWADIEEHPSRATEREVWEESGFQVQARRVVGVYDANRIEPMSVFHAYKIVFLCDLVGGQARPSNETSNVSFFSSEDIPEDLSGERTKDRHIRDAFAALDDPGWVTAFD
jgi:ADP-ribose pyrophosphatase YjhB (NUDIX family)